MKAASGVAPAEVPQQPQPNWEHRYPGRLRYELEALKRAGVTPDIDPDALARGRLVLSFDWPLDAKTTLRLKAIYPDSFPHLRPQVFLQGGLDNPPARHRSPVEGNLCLLGRDTRQWVPSWTLQKLLSEQLADAINGTGDEDPQGEPADYWWNQLGPRGTYCLVDSRWELGDVQEGSLVLQIMQVGTRKQRVEREPVKVPLIHAAVVEVRDAARNVLHEWEGALPPAIAAGQRITIPWVRLPETILPDANIRQQAKALRLAFPRLEHGQAQNVGRDMTVRLFAVSHPIEIGPGELGPGWVFFIYFGHPNAFKTKKGTKPRNAPSSTMTVLPAFRAGPQDIGYRVPAVQTLRGKSILVAGVGAVGAPAAVELARNGIGVLHLLEYDLVEPGNTVRWPLGASVWGSSKLVALRDFLNREYPATKVEIHHHCLGQTGSDEADRAGEEGDDAVLAAILPKVDLVIDGSASHGVTTLLDERCRQVGVPLVSLFATPTLEGGAVMRFAGEGGCANCLEYAWERGLVTRPPGSNNDDQLIQPPGCAERTFIGAGYDLQELSLQAIRLVVQTLSEQQPSSSVIQTLSLVDDEGQRCPPRWRIDHLQTHPECGCSR